MLVDTNHKYTYLKTIITETSEHYIGIEILTLNNDKKY